MTDSKFFEKKDIKLDETNVDKLLLSIKEEIKTHNAFTFLRILQNNYPKVWAAISKFAEAAHINENVEFLDDYRKHNMSPEINSNLKSLYDKYIKEGYLNIDDQLKNDFVNYYNIDQLKAKKVLADIAKNVSMLLVDAITTKSDFDAKFKEAWSEISNKKTQKK